MTEIEDMLLKLLEIPSVTGDEKGIGDFIISELKGLPLEVQAVEEGRFNIVVRKGNSKKWLVAHMDTVPGIVPVRTTDDRIFGRGACDNKQSIAASILLAKKIPDINMLFTISEEIDFLGAKYAAESGICKDAELVIVQEPTNFEVITAQCGVLSFTIKTAGREQHSSLPNPDSAIEKLIQELSTWSKEGWHAFNIGLIGGGTAENVISGSAFAKISIRPRNAEERDAILHTVKCSKSEIVFDKDILPYHSNFDLPERIAPHFSEMAFFPNSIQFGAGDIKNAHTIDEHILRSELNDLPERLITLLNDVHKKI